MTFMAGPPSPLPDPLRLGAALRDVRLNRGWTQHQLADAAGVSRAFVIDLERGKRPAAELTRVLAVARALGLALALVPAPQDDFDRHLSDLLDGNV